MTQTNVDYIGGIEANSQEKENIKNLFSQTVNQERLVLSGYSSYKEETFVLSQLAPESIKSEDDLNIFPISSLEFKRKGKTQTTIKILRTHYSKDIIECLDWLTKNHEVDSPNSIPYISSLLNLIKDYANRVFEDQFSSFLLALYDGLIDDDKYLRIEKEVYKKIMSYITILNNQDLDYKKVDKFIFKLEEIGLNITPY